MRWRPFLLGPIFKAQGWDSSPFNLYPAKGRNMWRDLERLCADLGLPFRRPIRFRNRACCRPGCAGRGPRADVGRRPFRLAVYRAEFGEGRRIDDPATIGGILMCLDVDPGPRCWRRHGRQQGRACGGRPREAQRLGVFGAPSFTTADGELFWGNDRLERALRGRSADLDEPSGVEPHRQAGRAMYSLASRTECSPKWKIEAASTAVAWPSRMPSTR